MVRAQQRFKKKKPVVSNVLVNLNAKYVLSKMCFDSKSLPAMKQMIRATHVVDIDTDMQAQCWLNSHLVCSKVQAQFKHSRFNMFVDSFLTTDH